MVAPEEKPAAEQFDKVTKQELEANLTDNHPLYQGHAQYAMILLNLSPNKWFELYMDTNSPFQINNFYDEQGHKNIENGEWVDPDEDTKCFNDDEA